MEPRVIPKFASEAEEAQWWFDNREELDQDWTDAAKAGRLKMGVGIRHARQQGNGNVAQPHTEQKRRAS